MNKEKTSSRKLKILMFNRWVGYNEGGNETHIKELAYFLSQRGHQISILTTGDSALQGLRPYLHKIYQVSSSQSYYSLEGSRLTNTLASFWFLAKSFLKLAKIILLEKERPDVLSVHFSLEAFLARFIRLVFGIPYILVLVGDTDFELVEGKYADVTIQISKFMAEECESFGYCPRVLTKGVDRRRFNPRISREERKNFLRDEKKEKLVVTVCRLDPRKNISALVESAGITKKTNPEIKYLIVGGGTEEEKLRRQIKDGKLEDTVFMVGAVPSVSDRLPKLYRAGDVFALPTLYEGFGYVYTEAMACGLPIVTTDIEATREVVADAGILVPLRNPQAMAEALIKVCSDDRLRRKLVARGRERVERWYWDKLILEYEKAYLETAQARPALPDRVGRFLASGKSLFFLAKKTIFFVLRPQRLRWGPGESKG